MIVIGILIALGASAASAFALVLQSQEARGTGDEYAGRLSLLWLLARRPRWLVGTALLTIAWPLQIVALLFAPLTVVQPVLATFQLMLVAIARFELKSHVGPREWLGALAVTAGVALVVVAAPHRTVANPAAGRVAIPLALVGLGAVAAFVAGRRRPSRGILVATAAGLGYAWADFADKLVSNAFSAGNALTGIIWLLAVACFGALALIEENTALQRHPAVQVAPVIGAIQEPLPVLMALAGGVEVWTGGVVRLAGVAAGLALAGLGATVLARSAAAARVAA
jgi:drug/metabolite transporter (DMT)-like permease